LKGHNSLKNSENEHEKAPLSLHIDAYFKPRMVCVMKLQQIICELAYIHQLPEDAVIWGLHTGSRWLFNNELRTDKLVSAYIRKNNRIAAKKSKRSARKLPKRNH
jgi:hypothetical protein